MKMNVDKVLKQVSQKEGVSVEEVKKEIENIIKIAMADINPDNKDIWNELVDTNNPPTASEFIERLANMAIEDTK